MSCTTTTAAAEVSNFFNSHIYLWCGFDHHRTSFFGLKKKEKEAVSQTAILSLFSFFSFCCVLAFLSVVGHYLFCFSIVDQLAKAALAASSLALFSFPLVSVAIQKWQFFPETLLITLSSGKQTQQYLKQWSHFSSFSSTSFHWVVCLGGNHYCFHYYDQVFFSFIFSIHRTLRVRWASENRWMWECVHRVQWLLLLLQQFLQRRRLSPVTELQLRVKVNISGHTGARHCCCCCCCTT